MTTPERSVEEIVELTEVVRLLVVMAWREEKTVNNVVDEIMDLFEAERQKRDEVVEEVNRSWREDPMTKEHHAKIIKEAVEAERERIIAFTKLRTDERIDPVMGEAFLMRNKGYNDGMRAVETFITQPNNPK